MITKMPVLDALPVHDHWGLDRSRELAGRAGLSLDLEYVHVVGTNGKGSTSAFLERMLRAQGYKTGLYTSPHLWAYNERALVNGKQITDRTLMSLESDLKRHVQAMEKEGKPPSPFEAFTVLSLQHFEEQGVQIAVVEAGLGGRLDSTNILDGKTAIVTNIALEHTELLGKTRAKIASEKAGIIKDGASVISGVFDRSASAPIAKAVHQKHASLFQMNRDFRYSNVEVSLQGTRFNFDSIGRFASSLPGLNASLLGAHQAHNASLAVAGALQLQSRGFPVSESSLRKGLSHTQWAGRLETLSRHPLTMVDAAHNDDGVSSLQAALRDLLVPSAGKPVLVFGVLSDKDYSSMVARLAPWVRSVVLTTPLLAERALAPQKLAPLFKKRGVPVQIVPKIPQALATAAKTAGRNGWVLVAGSLYLVGPARQRLIKRIRPKL